MFGVITLSFLDEALLGTKDLERQFEKLDKEKNGTILIHELTSALVENLNMSSFECAILFVAFLDELFQENGCLIIQNFRFWLEGAAPQTPRFFAGGAKPPQTPPLNGYPQHLIEAAKRGRLDQMLFFSAPLTIRRTTPERRRTPFE